MDPITGIGFAFGAGSFLLDTFDKAVQAYKLYSTVKSLGSVSGHLVAKLLIEECRLIQWGEGVGIRSVAEQDTKDDTRELDDRLQGNEFLCQTVLQTLAGIEDTLTDIDGLTAKYGLQILEENNAEEGKLSRNEIVLLLRPGSIPGASGLAEPSETSKALKERAQRLQESMSIRKIFKRAIKDKSGFEMLLERIRYYNDSLYSLLPKDNISSITRDVLASLISSATSEKLTQYTTVIAPSISVNAPPVSIYATIASAAQVSVQIANGHHPSPDDTLIDGLSITYDGEDSRLGTLSKQGRALTRVFVEELRYIPYGHLPHSNHDADTLTRKTTLEQITELAVLLKEPRHFGFATLSCLGVVTELTREDRYHSSGIKLIWEIPDTADPLQHPREPARPPDQRRIPLRGATRYRCKIQACKFAS